MAKILETPSRTFSEFLLLPQLTTRSHLTSKITHQAVLSSASKSITLNAPLASAAMQAVSGVDLSIMLARMGGLGFIFCSQSVESQADMVRQIKKFKAGFVTSDANIKPDDTLAYVRELQQKTGHSTVAVTADGTGNGKLLGMITSTDIWPDDPLDRPASDIMQPVSELSCVEDGVSLREANEVLRKTRSKFICVMNKDGSLKHLAFRKDVEDHYKYPYETVDAKKRLCVGAAVNTHDYQQRVPAIVEAGADVICFDSSDGYSEFQKDACQWVRGKYGDDVIMGGGNIVCSNAFHYLVEECGVDFVKVGIGGGSICITREQKGIGRGQASALIEIAEARDAYHKKTGRYIPICSDGGLQNDTQMIMALALGADFVMMGKYFAMMEESPTEKVTIRNNFYKPYWGEGSNRAKNWQRYTDGKVMSAAQFEEGVNAFVPFAGSMRDILPVTLSKLKSTMASCGVATLEEFREKAVLTLVSEQSYIEGGTSGVLTPESLSAER